MGGTWEGGRVGREGREGREVGREGREGRGEEEEREVWREGGREASEGGREGGEGWREGGGREGGGVPNLVAVRRSCQKGGGTDRQTDKGNPQLHIIDGHQIVIILCNMYAPCMLSLE